MVEIHLFRHMCLQWTSKVLSFKIFFLENKVLTKLCEKLNSIRYSMTNYTWYFVFLNYYHLFVCIKQNLEDQNISDNLPFSFSKFVYWPIFWKHDFYPINRFSMESKECLDKRILFHLSYFWTAINFAGCRFNQNLILRANEFTTKSFCFLEENFLWLI